MIYELRTLTILTCYIVELLSFIYFPTNSLTIDNDVLKITVVSGFQVSSRWLCGSESSQCGIKSIIIVSLHMCMEMLL